MTISEDYPAERSKAVTQTNHWGKRPKLTDKQRLDFVLSRVVVYEDGHALIDPLPQFITSTDIEVRRKYLDAAIRSEAALKKRKGGK